MPPEILDLILSFHRGVCEEAYEGDPAYQLYWAYDMCALRELLGMTKDKYRQVKSKFGRFLRRNRNAIAWLSRVDNITGARFSTPYNPRNRGLSRSP